MLLPKGVLKNSKGDISTFGIEQARSFPVLTTTVIGFIQIDITIMKTRVLRLLKKYYFSHNFPDLSFSIISKA